MANPTLYIVVDYTDNTIPSVTSNDGKLRDTIPVESDFSMANKRLRMLQAKTDHDLHIAKVQLEIVEAI